jgi:hypothetical protein
VPIEESPAEPADGPAVRAVPVADLLRTRRPGRAYPPDGYLSGIEVQGAWPTVWDQPEVARANDVRVERERRYSPLGYSTVPTYHAEDVQRVADGIAAGTAVLRPEWLRTSPEGRAAVAAADRAESARRIRSAVGAAVVVLVVLAVLVLPPLLS